MSDELDVVIASLTSDYDDYFEVFTLRDEVLASVVKKPRRSLVDIKRHAPFAKRFNLICEAWQCTEPGIFTIEGIYCPRKPDPRALHLGEAVSRRWFCGLHQRWVVELLSHFGVNHRYSGTAESWAYYHSGGGNPEWGLDACGHVQNNDGRGHKMPCDVCQTPPRTAP